LRARIFDAGVKDSLRAHKLSFGLAIRATRTMRNPSFGPGICARRFEAVPFGADAADR